MPVIAHYAVAADPHLETLDALGENLLKGEKIAGLTKNPEPTISPIQGMVNITAQRNPLIASHARYYIWHARDIKKKCRAKMHRRPLVIPQDRLLQPISLYDGRRSGLHT